MNAWECQNFRAPAAGLVTHLPHLAGGVLPGERGQVDHAQHHLERINLGRLLDAAGLEPLGPLLDADLVDAGRFREVGEG